MFRPRLKVPPTPQWLIVGLGNPGPEYRGTRHNVGFVVIDILAQRHRIKLDKSKHQARFGIGEISGTGVLLVKPLTFMNLSGRAVAPLAKEYGLDPAHILVLSDDKDLVVGRNRLKPKGGAGGHNGHRSLIESLGTEEYPRLKIGIGAPENGGMIDHVLGTFGQDEREVIQIALQRAADGVEVLAERGLEAAMNAVNEG